MGARKTTETKTFTTKAHGLLATIRNLEERADAIHTSLKRDLLQTEITDIERQKEKLEEEIFELENFSLVTNLNAGQLTMTREQCMARFKGIFAKRKELILLEEELTLNKEVYNYYFAE